MQAVKEKLQDMKEMRKVKKELQAEEKQEKDLAEANKYLAHEIRMAKQAEAEMNLHVAKAKERADNEIAKHEANHEQHH